MSYFIKYKLSFVSDRGNVYDLHILQKNYAGQPIVQKLGVAPVLSIEDGEGRVKGSSLSFAVQADVEGELKGLYTTNNKEFKVLLYRNSSLYWQGFVLPELYSENYIDPPYDVAVTASDQLGVLKNVEYQQEAGYKSLLEIIAYTLSITHLDLKIVQHLNLTLAGKERFLDGAYVATEGYYGQSCYDVLNSILLSCNACIQQYGNEWVIMSLTDVSTSYNKDGVNIEIPHAQLGQMGSAQVYPDGSLEMVNKPAVKGVTLNYAHVLKNSFLKNADCQSKDGWQYSFEPLDNRFPGTVDEFGVLYKCNCWQLPQKDVAVNGALQLWQDVNVKSDNTYNCQLSVDYRMDLGASLLLMAIIHEGVDGVTRRLTSEGWKEGGSATDKNSYINVTGTPSELWLTWAKDIADFSKYEKATVQFQLPAVDGVLRIGFINTTDTSFVNPLSGQIYLTKIYLTYMGIAGKASTTVVEEDATNAQEEISLAYGERVPASNEALAVLNTLRSASGVPREQFSLNNTSGVKSYDSYFLAMLQEMSRYYAVKKMHLQGVVMGISPLHLLYKDVFSGKVMRLVSGEYDLLQDTLGVLLEEVPDAWVDYEPEVYATDNSVPGVSSSGVVTVGGGGGTSLLAVNAKGEVYVKDERVLLGAEADFGKVVLPAEKPEESSDKVYIYSQVPAADEQLDNKAVNVHLMVDELVELRDDFDALNDLLNSDVAGVINTWDEIVDFLNEYGESQDLASILSQMNTDIANRVPYTDFEKLEDAVDSNYKSISNIASTIPTIESSIFALATRVGNAEGAITSIQATYVDKASAQEINGVKTFKNGLKIGDAELVWDSTNKALKIVGSAYITKDLSFGGYQAPGGGGTSGGGIVTIKVNGQEYTSQNGIVTIPNYPSLAGYATEGYVTSRGYITNAALNGYAKLTDIPTSLPASDVYAWAKAASKPSYTASEVGALSTSGGTLYYSGHWGLKLSSTSGADNYIWLEGIVNGATNLLGGYGFNGYNNPVYVSPTGYAYPLYHTGNFNPANYLPLSGGTVGNGTTNYPLTINAPQGGFIKLNVGTTQYCAMGADDGLGTWITEAGGNYIHIRGGSLLLNNAYTFLHSGNYSSYALPLSGGTVTNDLQVNGYLSTQKTWLRLGAYYLIAGTTWKVTDASWQNEYALIHSGNYANTTDKRYLQLSGGTISSSHYQPLIINSTYSAVGDVRIAFSYNGDIKGLINWDSTTAFRLYNYISASYIGVKDDGTPVYNEHTLIHSGNYSSYALPLSGGTIKGDLYLDYSLEKYSRIYFVDRRIGSSRYADEILVIRNGAGANQGAIGVYGNANGVSYYYFGHNDYNGNNLRIYSDKVTFGYSILIHSDNIGSYNAGSATKLQTARSIWGRSFDGTGDITGAASFVNGRVNIPINGDRITFNGSGYSMGILAMNNGNTYIEAPLTSDSSSAAQTPILIGWRNGVYPFYIAPSGNVLVGTTSDNGYKFQIYDSSSNSNAILISTTNGNGEASIFYQALNSQSYWAAGIACGLANQNVWSIFSSNAGKWIFAAKTTGVDINGNLTVSGGATFGGDVYSEGTMAMAKLASSSDAKLKENIKWLSADKSMEVVRALRPSEWNWKKDSTHSFGFIAQEVQPIVPEMVSSINDTLRLEYNQLHAFEIGAIQHIDSEVEVLKRRVTELENELNEYRRNAQWQ